MSKTGTILDSRPEHIMIQGVVYKVKYINEGSSHPLCTPLCTRCDCDYTINSSKCTSGCRFRCRCLDMSAAALYLKAENKELEIKPGKLYIKDGMQFYAPKKAESCEGCFFYRSGIKECSLTGLVCKGCIPLKWIIGKGV